MNDHAILLRLTIVVYGHLEIIHSTRKWGWAQL